jgi:hypothetical protein
MSDRRLKIEPVPQTDTRFPTIPDLLRRIEALEARQAEMNEAFARGYFPQAPRP